MPKHIPPPAFTGPRLQPREIQVLKLMCNGMKVKEIARELNMTPKSVHGYRCRLTAKTGCTTGAMLGVYAVREGIVEIEPEGAVE